MISEELWPKVLSPGQECFSNDVIIFTAGPVQGAPKWQARVPEIMGTQIELLKELRELWLNDFKIADPSNYCGDFTKQVWWEYNFLERASRLGVILFWLAKPEKTTLDRAYGQTSRFELGEWVSNYEKARVRVLDSGVIKRSVQIVVGVEEGFTGANYIRERVGGKLGPGLHIHDTLEETCFSALQIVAQRLYGENE